MTYNPYVIDEKEIRMMTFYIGVYLSKIVPENGTVDLSKTIYSDDLITIAYQKPRNITTIKHKEILLFSANSDTVYTYKHGKWEQYIVKLFNKALIILNKEQDEIDSQCQHQFTPVSDDINVLFEKEL